MYTLIERAKASGVDPLGCLEAVLECHGTRPANKSNCSRPGRWHLSCQPTALTTKN